MALVDRKSRYMSGEPAAEAPSFAIGSFDGFCPRSRQREAVATFSMHSSSPLVATTLAPYPAISGVPQILQTQIDGSIRVRQRDHRSGIRSAEGHLRITEAAECAARSLWV